MKQIFGQFDADGDGKLDIYEIARAFRALGLPKVSVACGHSLGPSLSQIRLGIDTHTHTDMHTLSPCSQVYVGIAFPDLRAP